MGWVENEIFLQSSPSEMGFGYDSLNSKIELSELVIATKFSTQLKRNYGRELFFLRHNPNQNGNDCLGVENRRKAVIEISNISDPRGGEPAFDSLYQGIQKKLDKYYTRISNGNFILLMYHPRIIRCFRDFMQKKSGKTGQMIAYAKSNLASFETIPFNEIWYMDFVVGNRKLRVHSLDLVYKKSDK